MGAAWSAFCLFVNLGTAGTVLLFGHAAYAARRQQGEDRVFERFEAAYGGCRVVSPVAVFNASFQFNDLFFVEGACKALELGLVTQLLVYVITGHEKADHLDIRFGKVVFAMLGLFTFVTRISLMLQYEPAWATQLN
uniref:Uncharacterized protein n=1 Tax=Chromera velia CCMP2878 TaxID=1169474 RepID=A0A0G4F6Q7_9ALVE|eukprot:Cvel_15486.t1-p1 / transcript=Cvel_15486.t1 / gene=Cvel_15486 / organism=Chromera_velia_CCMP2878 / gene_product=hypothetical protein / transcript_product=hypothetical protein / location=Cvel_scaffold1148:53498-53905(-) / protein_length=136 / sequence_SO=supercontig / SO=protein_coding / is_pseudo=false